MVNLELMKDCDHSDLIEMGFKEENDGSGDPRGVDWNIRNKNFHLMVDPWLEVKIRRISPHTDFITVQCFSRSDLQSIIDWITD